MLGGFLCWAHLFTEVRICSFLGSAPFSSFCLSSRENIAGMISIYLWTMSLYIVKTSLLPPQILRILVCSRGGAQPQQVIGPGCGKGQVAAPPWKYERRFQAASPGTVTSISHGATDDNFPSIQLSGNPGSHSLPEKRVGLPCPHRLLPGTTLPGHTSAQLPGLIFCSHILRPCFTRGYNRAGRGRDLSKSPSTGQSFLLPPREALPERPGRAAGSSCLVS